jgi:hypothetical protein
MDGAGLMLAGKQITGLGVKMTAVQDHAQEAKWQRWRGVAELYHAYFTGLILTVVTRRGTSDAAEFMFGFFAVSSRSVSCPASKNSG